MDSNYYNYKDKLINTGAEYLINLFHLRDTDKKFLVNYLETFAQRIEVYIEASEDSFSNGMED